MLFFIQDFRWCSPKRLTWLTHVLIQLHTDVLPTFNGPLSGTTWVSRYQKGKTNLDFTEARDSEWQWHQLGYMQVCISLQTDNSASTPPLSFLRAGCPSCRPTSSVKALKGCSHPVNQQKCKMYLDCIVWPEICSSWSLPLMYYLFVIAKFLSTCSHFWIISLEFSFVL